MNEALRVPEGGLLTTSDLAAHPDFTLGLAVVSPSTRTMVGPGGKADVEPRVMQVLVVLADAGGQVVTRETLFQRCWGGVYVGDDSLNRAIGAVRKLAAQIADNSFEIETIPRTGYRLSGAQVGRVIDAEARGSRFTRRELAAGGLGVLAVGGGASWWFLELRPRRRFDALVASAEQAIRKQTADDRTVRDLKAAVSLRPDNARALGLLAYLRSTQTAAADPKVAEPARDDAQAAAAKALAINSKEPYALLAMFELQGSTIDWAERDRRLRQIIAIDPTHVPAIAELVLLTQAAGLNRESWSWNERAISLDPFSFDYLSKRAMKLWIAERVPQADKVIDQVMAMYPTNSWPRWVRFVIYAMTDRPRAAQAIAQAKPAILGPEEIALWRPALTALDQRSPETIAKAREACFSAAAAIGSFATDTVMIMCALGDVDAAFAIANGFLLSRGSLVSSGNAHRRDDLNDATWRINTQYLFTPPCRNMRADRRFLSLCDGMGLTDYWRARGVRPDYLRI